MGTKTGIFEMIIKLFKSDIQQLKKKIAEFLHFNNPLHMSTVLLLKLFYYSVKKLLF